jgi:peptidoglycan hydrolase-like protein with peptidoglycan-binding domain
MRCIPLVRAAAGRGLLVLAVLWAAAGSAGAGYDEGAAALERGDHEAAYREFIALAEKGDARAQNQVGVMFHKGLVPAPGVTRGQPARANAFVWYRRAAEQGYASALYNLGQFYEAGIVVPRDHLLAYMLYELAAAGGGDYFVEARDELGRKMTAGQISRARQLAQAWRPGQPLDIPAPRGPARADDLVRQAQRLLAQLGYRPGAADGTLGRSTITAIERFQADNGLRIDGQVTPELVATLEAAATAGRAAAPPAPPPAASPARANMRLPGWRRLDDLPMARIMSHYNAQDVFRAVRDSVWLIVAFESTEDLQQKRNLSQGSAVAVAPSLLVTNCHVVGDRPFIMLVRDKTGHRARLAAADSASDRCILRVEGVALKPIPGVRRLADVKVGERAFSLGSPRGLDRTFGEGVIAGVREMGGLRYVQTTAPISPGSSGGALFDESGNLIGITTYLIRESQSLNFAIAAEEFWR